MRISELEIKNYGPLKNFKIENLSNFNLIWGFNESGKTLAIEALIRFLLGKKSNLKIINSFNNLVRVEDYPDGYCNLEYYEINNRKGKVKNTVKLPKNKFFIDVLKQIEEGRKSEFFNLTIDDFRNIFIIRNSDLLISDENKFYIDISSKLTGLNSELINKTINEIRRISNLTDGNNYKNTEPVRLKTRIENSKRLINEIKDYKKLINQNKYEELEKKYFLLDQNIKLLLRKLKDLDNARNKEKYVNSKKIINEIEENLQSIYEYKDLNGKDLDIWEKIEQKIENLKNDEFDIKNEISNLENEIQKLEDEKEEKEQLKSEFDYKSNFVNQTLKPLIEQYNKKFILFQKTRIKYKNRNKIFKIGFFTFFFLTVFFSTVPLLNFIKKGFNINSFNLVKILKNFIKNFTLIDTFTFFTILAFISFILIFFFLIGWLFLKVKLEKNEVNLKELLETIKIKLKESGLLDERNLDKVSFNKIIDEFERNKKQFDRIYYNVDFKLNNFKDRLYNELSRKLKDISSEMNMLNNEIEKIKGKLGISNIQEFKEKLGKKNNLKDSVLNLLNKVITILYIEKDISNYKHDNYFYTDEFKKLLNMIKNHMDNYKEYANIKTDFQYNDNLYNKLKEEKEKLQEEFNLIKDKLKKHKTKLSEIEKKAIEILQDKVFCETFSDLDFIQKKLEAFIKKHVQDRLDAIRLINIFQSIDNEEKQKIKDIIDNNENITGMLKKLTNGRYEEVFYKVSNNKNQASIYVRTKENIILDVTKLSSGTFDQLYFILRISIANMLLKNQKGFFIFDDPLIKSDPERLDIMINMIKNLAKSGWQILFFSSKGEIRELLKKELEKDVIKLYEIKRFN